jgi:hypothetical protein
MGETGMIWGSGTDAGGPAVEKPVGVEPGASERVLTSHAGKDADRYAVRISKGKETVVLRVNTELMSQRSKIAEANESIRRRTRG